MNKLLIACAIVGCSAALIADTTATKPQHTSGKERRERRLAKIAAEGGLVAKPYAGKWVMIVNDQNRIAEKDFFREKQSPADLFQFPIKVVPSKTDVSKAAVVITVSDNANAPALLVAPEIPWAGVNVGALAADKPKDDVLVARVQKEIWRAFMYACGAANSQMASCVMRPIFGVKDLDFQNICVPCPESLPRVMTTAKALGIGETSSCTYKQACVEGWAPAPTNDLQKAIADQVKADKERGPTNPIKIAPPAK